MSVNNYIKGIDTPPCFDKMLNKKNKDYKIVQNNGLKSDFSIQVFVFKFIKHKLKNKTSGYFAFCDECTHCR